MQNLKNLPKNYSESDNELTPSSDSDINLGKLPPNYRLEDDEIGLDQKEITKLGPFVESYFFLKLKKYLNANSDFRGSYSLKKHIQNLKESVLEYIKGKSNEIKIQGINLIHFAEDIFNIKSKDIQIDSLFPNITGKKVKQLLADAKGYCYHPTNMESNIRDEENYTLVVESTHNILSTLNKKSKQMDNYFKAFSETRKLYSGNIIILNKFYTEFLKFFKIIQENKEYTHEELMKNSNFIYVLCSNKNYKQNKLFQESMTDKNKFNDLISLLKHIQPREEASSKEDKKNEENNQIESDKKKKKSEKKQNTNIKINEKNEVYQPEEYVNHFKNVLDKIEKENDSFILLYLDCYEKLFVPYSILEDFKLGNKTINNYNENYKNVMKSNEQLKTQNQKIQKQFDEMKKDYESMKKDYESRNKDYEPMKKDYESRNKDYESMKKDYESMKKNYDAIKNENVRIEKKYDSIYQILKTMLQKTSPDLLNEDGEIDFGKLGQNI